MKKTIILIIATLVVSLGATATVGIVSNNRTYSAEETDEIVTELQNRLNETKTDLDKQIEKLTQDYNAKDEELLVSITANKKALSDLDVKCAAEVALLNQADEANQKAINDLNTAYVAKVAELTAADQANETALAELKTNYEAKVSELQQADKDNADALDKLKTEYNTKVAELETAIQTANQTIESNKTELENKITALTSVYTSKMAEIDALLETLQNTDTTQDGKIAELVTEITKLQNATRITAVAFKDNGDLLITFGDGTTQTVNAPEKHVHTFDDYKCFNTDTTIYCEERLFYRICIECNSIEWKNGAYSDHTWETVTTAPTCQAQGYDTKTCKICGKVEIENYVDKVDHSWQNTYSYDNDYHWYDCTTCDDVKDKAEHTVDDNGLCTVCNNLVGATAGVVYALSSDKTYYSVTDYQGTATRVRIADTYNNLPITIVSDAAFYGNTDITEVIIPAGVTAIGDSAFYECTSLVKIDLPNTLLSIGANAFSESALKNVVIPNSVTELGEKVFCRCNSLTEVVIGNGLKVIPRYAFQHCYNLKNVTIPDSVTSIVSWAFFYCSSLTSITIPDSVTSIGYYAFSVCYKLINKVKGVHYVDCWVVDSDEALVKADILAGTRGIACDAFYNCSSLTSVTIPDSVTSIGDYAFSGCSGLTSITIPDSVTLIGYYAFRRCDKLNKVYYEGSETDWDSVSIESSNYSLTEATKYYYSETYAEGNYWHYDESGNVVEW